MSKNVSVLVVDDDEVACRGIKKGLEENTGFAAKTALDGASAIKMAETEHFDVVIVDLVMPGMNGVETCRGIKKVSPGTEVVLLSGFPSEVEKLQMSFIEAGGKDLYIRKPLLAGEIAEAITKLLKEKRGD
mgnify:FL=1